MAVVSIGQVQFQEMIQSSRPLLVNFCAPWCGYCSRIGPACERIAKWYADDLDTVEVNIDEQDQLAQQERIEVVPTLVIYREGKELGSIVAPESRAMIEEFICQTLGKHK